MIYFVNLENEACLEVCSNDLLILGGVKWHLCFVGVWYEGEYGEDHWQSPGGVFDYYSYGELGDLYYFWGGEIFNVLYLSDLDEGAAHWLKLFERGMAGRPNLKGFEVCDGELLFGRGICLDVYDESRSGGLVHFRPAHKIEELSSDDFLILNEYVQMSGDYSFFYTGVAPNVISLKNCILAHRFLGTRKKFAMFSRDDGWWVVKALHSHWSRVSGVKLLE